MSSTINPFPGSTSSYRVLHFSKSSGRVLINNNYAYDFYYYNSNVQSPRLRVNNFSTTTSHPNFRLYSWAYYGSNPGNNSTVSSPPHISNGPQFVEVGNVLAQSGIENLVFQQFVGNPGTNLWATYNYIGPGVNFIGGRDVGEDIIYTATDDNKVIQYSPNGTPYWYFDIQVFIYPRLEGTFNATISRSEFISYNTNNEITPELLQGLLQNITYYPNPNRTTNVQAFTAVPVQYIKMNNAPVSDINTSYDVTFSIIPGDGNDTISYKATIIIYGDFFLNSNNNRVSLDDIFLRNTTSFQPKVEYKSSASPNGISYVSAGGSWNNETLNGQSATNYIPSVFDIQHNTGFKINGTDIGSLYLAKYTDYFQPAPGATQQWTGTFEPWVDEIYVIAQGQGGYANVTRSGDDYPTVTSKSGGNGGMIGWSHTGVANMGYTVTTTSAYAQLYLANGDYCIAYKGGDGYLYGHYDGNDTHDAGGDDLGDLGGYRQSDTILGGGSNHVGGTVQFNINGVNGAQYLNPSNMGVNDPGPSYANWINGWKDRGHAQYWSHGSNPQPEPGAVRVYKKQFAEQKGGASSTILSAKPQEWPTYTSQRVVFIITECRVYDVYGHDITTECTYTNLYDTEKWVPLNNSTEYDFDKTIDNNYDTFLFLSNGVSGTTITSYSSQDTSTWFQLRKIDAPANRQIGSIHLQQLPDSGSSIWNDPNNINYSQHYKCSGSQIEVELYGSYNREITNVVNFSFGKPTTPNMKKRFPPMGFNFYSGLDGLNENQITLNNLPYGNGTYVIKTSDALSNVRAQGIMNFSPATGSFSSSGYDATGTNFSWQVNGGRYNANQGYSYGNRNFGSVLGILSAPNGEYIEVTLPSPVILTTVEIYGYGNTLNYSPTIVYVYGKSTITNSAYTLIGTTSKLPNPYTWAIMDTTTNTSMYDKYAFIIYQVLGNVSSFVINELSLSGFISNSITRTLEDTEFIFPPVPIKLITTYLSPNNKINADAATRSRSVGIVENQSYGNGRYIIDVIASRHNINTSIENGNLTLMNHFPGPGGSYINPLTYYNSIQGHFGSSPYIEIYVTYPTCILFNKLILLGYASYSVFNPESVLLAGTLDGTTYSSIAGVNTFSAMDGRLIFVANATTEITKLHIQVNLNQTNTVISEIYTYGDFYNSLHFDTNNNITIENTLPSGVQTNVTFRLETGYEMPSLVLVDFSGSSTAYVRYKVANTETTMSYSGGFSLDDVSLNVFTQGFTSGKINIMFSIDTEDEVSYKLMGTQVTDYISSSPVIKQFPPVKPLVNLVGATGGSQYNEWRSGEVVEGSAQYGTGIYRVRSLVSDNNGFNLTNFDGINIFNGNNTIAGYGVTPYNATGTFELDLPYPIQLASIAFYGGTNTNSDYNLSVAGSIVVKVSPTDDLLGTYSYNASTFTRTLAVTDTRQVKTLEISIVGGHRSIYELTLYGYVAEIAYSNISFDANNKLTIANTLLHDDADNVTFSVASGFTLPKLRLDEFSGGGSTVGYHVTKIVDVSTQEEPDGLDPDANYTGAFSVDNLGTNVFPNGFTEGSYTIEFKLMSGISGTKFKLTGTQTQ